MSISNPGVPVSRREVHFGNTPPNFRGSYALRPIYNIHKGEQWHLNIYSWKLMETGQDRSSVNAK
ncbi:unnamed protein product [Clonostachys rosea f. rosea IK726]|uniref:Uncharacterized protein n=2 Tax=Bionectria ochroleuca TaxID=29856 RepID=A0A0B7KKD6_BIOOC|nr:unnamed protein product [Clonostachys rosea f. rosea IK726]